MDAIVMWHGCVIQSILVAGIAADPAAHGNAAPEPIAVRSSSFALEYEVNDAALPLTSVEIWVSDDQGQTWTRNGEDEDRQPPVFVTAPGEGLYAYFVILTNETGSSSSAPTQGIVPHAYVLVDTTEPVVQVHSVQQRDVLGRPAVQIQWSAVDTQLGPRPIDIEYRRPTEPEWQKLPSGPIANTGRFDLPLPDGWVGAVDVRVAAQDRAGRRVVSDAHTLEVFPPHGPSDTAVATSDAAVVSVSAPVADRAARLVREGLRHRDRGENRMGIARLREAVRLNPQLVDAWSEMAMMLFRIGDHDKALDAFELALKQSPRHRPALRGAAMVLRRRNDYAGAAAKLRAILEHEPEDAETWLNLGDVAIFQGNEILARECYQKSLDAQPDSERIVAEARKRLDLMAEASKGFER